MQPDGNMLASITASWLVPLDNFVLSGGYIEVEYQIDSAADWTPGPVIAGEKTSAVIVPVNVGQTYRVRVRGVSVSGVRSSWVISSTVVAAGDVTAPGVPTSVAISAIYKGARVVWTNPTDADLAYVEVYESTTSSPAPNAGSVGSARVYGTDYVRQGLNIGDTRWYWVRAVDASGNKSAWAGGGSATASAIDTTGIFPITSTQIADDSISTPKLQANSVTALKVGSNEIITTSANMANAVITTAKIADLQVTTLKIGNNAVTVPVSAYTSGAITMTGGESTVQTCSITSSGAPINIIASCTFRDTNPSATRLAAEFRIKRGGTTIFTSNAIIVARAYDSGSGNYLEGAIPFSCSINETPGSGTHTYTLTVDISGYTAGSTVEARSLFLMETKK
jgi:predicted phage tail protein